MCVQASLWKGQPGLPQRPPVLALRPLGSAGTLLWALWASLSQPGALDPLQTCPSPSHHAAENDLPKQPEQLLTAAHVRHLSAWEAEAGGPGVQHQLGLHETASKPTNRSTRPKQTIHQQKQPRPNWALALGSLTLPPPMALFSWEYVPRSLVNLVSSQHPT